MVNVAFELGNQVQEELEFSENIDFDLVSCKTSPAWSRGEKGSDKDHDNRRPWSAECRYRPWQCVRSLSKRTSGRCRRPFENP